MKVKKYYNLLQRTVSIIMAIAIVLVTSFAGETRAYAASISVSDTGTEISVNTGAGLVYTIDETNGDMTSCKLNGTELNASNKASQIGSGLGSATVTWTTFSSGSEVLITCSTSTITQYYASKYGDNTIYMATYITAEPSVGELRYIFRGNMDVLNTVPTYSDLRGNSGAIESTDVYGFSTGYTASKYYGNDQAKDLTIKGATGTNVGVFMAYGNRETSSGGPFQRDIQFQTAYPDNMNTEINNYMNSTHAKTEEFRTGLFGPYALCFTNGLTPNLPDYSWMSGLGLQGYVSDSNRCTVVLNGLTGTDASYNYTIGFANTTAQYWTTATSTGSAVCSGMKPGTYTMTVYKGELAVYTGSVTVTAGSTTTIPTCAITDDPGTTSTIWRIGNWDGTPLEFANGKNIQYYHPSDIRNTSWGPTTFAVGSEASQFPAAQFRLANSPENITFDLSANQAAVDHTLKIGITTAYNNGRPSVIINGHALTNPSAATEPSQRTLTTGTYRGNNATFSWNIPSSYFVAGSNTITIKPISGSTDSSTYLSASYAFDCLELDGTPDAIITGITINQADNLSVMKGDIQQFTATVAGTGTFDNSVNWAITTTTGASVDTKISNTGLLTVASNEAVDSLKIRATSVADKDIYADINVKLITPFTYAINYNLAHISVMDVETDASTTLTTTGSAVTTTGPSVTITLAPENGYKLSNSANVEMDGNSSPDYDYDSNTGKLFIRHVTGDLTIEVVGESVVKTTGVSNISENSALLEGTASEGNESIIGQGFEWKITNGGTYVEVAGTLDNGNITANLTGLSIYTNYTIRAFVKTKSGTYYGEEKTFKTDNGSTSSSSSISSGGTSSRNSSTSSGGTSSSITSTDSSETTLNNISEFNTSIVDAITNKNAKIIEISIDSNNNVTITSDNKTTNVLLNNNNPIMTKSILDALKANTDKTIVIKTLDSSIEIKSNTEGQIQFTQNNIPMANGFTKVDNTEYYLNENGIMQMGWIESLGANWYHLNTETGIKDTDWLQDTDGNWYYLEKTTGAMKTGWLQDTDGNWYYLDKTTGAMKTGWIKDAEKWYYLYSNGSLAVNTSVEGYLVNENGEWFN